MKLSREEFAKIKDEMLYELTKQNNANNERQTQQTIKLGSKQFSR